MAKIPTVGDNCKLAVRAKWEKKASKKDIEAVEKNVLQLIAITRSKLGIPEREFLPDNVITAIINKAVEDVEQKAMQLRKGALLDDKLLIEARKRIGNAIPDATPFRGFEALLVGSPGTTKIGGFLKGGKPGVDRATALFLGDMKSVSSLADTITQTLNKTFLESVVQLGKDISVPVKDITGMFKKVSFNDDVARELFGLDGGKSVTGNRAAHGVAMAIDNVKEIIRKRANDAGAFVDRLEGHIITQSHNQSAVLRAAGWNTTRQESLAKWKEFITPLLNQERTFKGGDPDGFLDEAFLSIVDGKFGDVLFSKLSDDINPASLAANISRHRVLHFKDAESFILYNKQFGTGTIMQGFLFGMRRTAKKTALMERLGANPKKNLKKLMDEVKGNQEFNKAGTQITDRQAKRIEKYFEEVSGDANIPESPRASDIVNVIKRVNDMAHLGQATIASFSDLGFVAANANYHGIGFLDAYAQLFKHNVFTGRGKFGSFTKTVNIKLLDTGLDGMLGSIAARFSMSTNVPGVMSDLSNNFFKFSGLEWWTNLQKEGFGHMLSNHLGNNLSKGFDNLDPKLSRSLIAHGIQKADWDIIRKAKFLDDNGKVFVTADAIMASDMRSLFRSAREQRDLSDSLTGMFLTESDFAVPTPGARERAITRAGRPGSVLGSLSDLFWQFKMFPLTVITKAWNRQLAPHNVPGSIHLMVMSVLLGYASLSAKDALKNKSARDPRNPKTWMQSFMQGGGAGIYGDVLFKDFSLYGRDIFDALAGPTFGAAKDVSGIFSDAVRGRGKAAGKAINLIMQKAPYSNFYFNKQITDYLFMWHIQESLNPGYLRRLEQRVKKEDQDFLIGNIRPQNRLQPF